MNQHKSKAIYFNKTAHIDPFDRHILKFNIFTFIAFVNIMCRTLHKVRSERNETNRMQTNPKHKTDFILFVLQMRQFLVRVSHFPLKEKKKKTSVTIEKMPTNSQTLISLLSQSMHKHANVATIALTYSCDTQQSSSWLIHI